jgi:hypothetical protein
MSHIVVPSIVRLPLSGGFFVDVTRELNAGEYFDLQVALADRRAYAKVLAYVVGWSLLGPDDQPLPYSLDLDETVRRDTVRNLKVPTVRELLAVIDKHEKAQEAASQEKKTAPATAPSSSAPSSSGSGSA